MTERYSPPVEIHETIQPGAALILTAGLEPGNLVSLPYNATVNHQSHWNPARQGIVLPERGITVATFNEILFLMKHMLHADTRLPYVTISAGGRLHKEQIKRNNLYKMLGGEKITFHSAGKTKVLCGIAFKCILGNTDEPLEDFSGV